MNRLVVAGLLTFAAMAPVLAQTPIKIGEINSYSAIMTFGFHGNSEILRYLMHSIKRIDVFEQFLNAVRLAMARSGPDRYENSGNST